MIRLSLRPLFWCGCWCSLWFASAGYGFHNYCTQIRDPAPRASTYCQGMTIPAHKTRNFLGERLVCDSAEHSHTRHPVDFDEENWRDMLTVEPGEARKILRNLPDPSWQGALDYDTHLEWSWQECRLVTNFSCGSYTVCHKVNSERGDVECHEEPETCYQDVKVSASHFCSHEQTTFDVAFQKTGNEEYPERLANGYDLLPGESEVVTVDNGSGFFNKQQMSPRLFVTEPRNQYKITRRDGDGYESGELQCRQHSDYHIGFDVYPEQRIRSRSSNAFSLPQDVDGESIEALIWQNTTDRDGTPREKSYPVALRVQDYGAASMTEFARDVGDLFKHMVVRIELFENSWIPWPFPQATIYIKEGEGVVQTLNALSEKQDVRRSKLWELLLAAESHSPSKNIYRSPVPWFLYYPASLILPERYLSYENHLKPGTTYRLRLTVYQRGVSLYNQSCEDDPDAWDCRFYLGGGWLSPSRYESGYFSNNSLDVEFTTPEDLNKRSWWPMFWSSSGPTLVAIITAGVLHFMGV